MIPDGYYWKKPLLEMARRLKKSNAFAEPSDAQLARIERDVFIGFYSVRKLIESEAKVTDAIKRMKVNVEWYPNRLPVTWRNNHRIDDLYDLSSPGKEIRDIEFVCGRIIHSFVFVPVWDEHGHGLATFMFTSDIDRNKKLYSLSVDEVIQIFESFGSNYPRNIIWRIDPVTGDETTLIR